MTHLTVPIVAITAAFSIFAFNKSEYMARYQFNAYMIKHRNQWYRFLTHAFLHADWLHLIVNMLVLWSFGGYVEYNLAFYFGNLAPLIYLILYIGAIIISSISTYLKHKDDHWYNAVGASGAVSAVMFSSVVFGPFMEIRLYGIIPLPAIVWGLMYILYSAYSGSKANDNINHEAHLYGGLFGMIFTLVLSKDIALSFINQITFAIR
jgi:membrane associated rhomboid family serine protease